MHREIISCEKKRARFDSRLSLQGITVIVFFSTRVLKVYVYFNKIAFFYSVKKTVIFSTSTYMLSQFFNFLVLLLRDWVLVGFLRRLVMNC